MRRRTSVPSCGPAALSSSPSGRGSSPSSARAESGCRTPPREGRRFLRSAGERRNGNFVEQLYESAAGTFILSPRITWGDGERARTLADQVSLRHLVEFGERLQRDAIALLDRAAFEGEEIASATVEATVRFADPSARAAFLDEYLQLTAELIDKHAAADGDAYLVGLAVHPSSTESA